MPRVAIRAGNDGSEQTVKGVVHRVGLGGINRLDPAPNAEHFRRRKESHRSGRQSRMADEAPSGQETGMPLRVLPFLSQVTNLFGNPPTSFLGHHIFLLYVFCLALRPLSSLRLKRKGRGS